jgi:hypothetical protein
MHLTGIECEKHTPAWWFQSRAPRGRIDELFERHGSHEGQVTRDLGRHALAENKVWAGVVHVCLSRDGGCGRGASCPASAHRLRSRHLSPTAWVTNAGVARSGPATSLGVTSPPREGPRRLTRHRLGARRGITVPGGIGAVRGAWLRGCSAMPRPRRRRRRRTVCGCPRFRRESRAAQQGRPPRLQQLPSLPIAR